MASSISMGPTGTLWHRELTRFFRQPSRIAGAVGTPLIVWLLVGSGLSGSFRLPGGARIGLGQPASNHKHSNESRVRTKLC